MGCSQKTWQQLLVVMRHSERLDFADEDAWFQHPDSRSFPMDPPITTRGKSLAKFQGQTLTELCNKLGTPIDVVITSPFHRCVQTAAAIIEVLPMRNGKKVPILIDCEIAEVGLYKKPPGISDPGLIKAHQEFCSRRRTFDEVAALPDLQGIEKLNANSFVGIAPPFPEQRRSAHIRGLYRFAEWLERGRYARLNFLIVTHQDLVHTFCSMIKPEVCIEWVKYCGWGAAFVKRKDFGNLSADAIQKRSTKPPPPLHSLQITSELGSGVRWSPYTVDPRTGNLLRWYPAEDETGVAAIAAIFSNQQSTELQEMKRYADTQALQRAFRGGKTFSLIMSAANSRSENELEDSVRDKPPSTEDIDIAKLEISDAYEKVMLNSTVMEPPKRSTSEEEMVSCERSATVMARKIEPRQIGSGSELGSLQTVAEGEEATSEDVGDKVQLSL